MNCIKVRPQCTQNIIISHNCPVLIKVSPIIYMNYKSYFHQKNVKKDVLTIHDY
jgi:hypothetical protein